MEQEFNSLQQQFQRDFEGISGSRTLEALRVKYLGRKATLTQLFSKIPTLAKEEKGLWGKRLNFFKQEITVLLNNKTKETLIKEEELDLTFPSSFNDAGSRHVLSTVTQKICTIFEKLGFAIVEGKEIEDEWHNFEALNIPLEHPSRDAFDTFYLDIPQKKKGKLLLRSHTSPSQIRAMQKLKPPLAVISPGRVYRPDEVDASHSFMFHQIEGFAVDTTINFAHLKGALLYFAREFFSKDVKLRFRPHFFPFTEPSAEVDLSCIICSGLRPKTQNSRQKKNEMRNTLLRSSSFEGQASNEIRRCSVCKGKGWLEILGCGMIHPNVLEACGINSKKYRGFAFGMGIERIAMLKYGIDDIRLFYENDVRFLEQFCL